jgi:hypothetical protein
VSFSKRWRALVRPRPAIVLAAVAVWLVAVTALHVGVNSRRAVGRVAEARSLPVGGLPVT